MSEYTVSEVRYVEIEETHTGMFTGKQVTVKNNHGGQIAVYVRRGDEFGAWGFGGCKKTAEANAVANAIATAN